MPLKTILKYLHYQSVQRMIYAISLVLWLVVRSDDFQYVAVLDICSVYTWQLLTPLVLLSLQVIFNNKKLWYAVMANVSLYSLWII